MRKTRRRRPAKLTEFADYLWTRCHAGCHKASRLHHEFRQIALTTSGKTFKRNQAADETDPGTDSPIEMPGLIRVAAVLAGSRFSAQSSLPLLSAGSSKSVHRPGVRRAFRSNECQLAIGVQTEYTEVTEAVRMSQTIERAWSGRWDSNPRRPAWEMACSLKIKNISVYGVNVRR